MLAQYKEGEIGDAQTIAAQNNLYERVIYRCIIGSRAYGLDHCRVRYGSARHLRPPCQSSLVSLRRS